LRESNHLSIRATEPRHSKLKTILRDDLREHILTATSWQYPSATTADSDLALRDARQTLIPFVVRVAEERYVPTLAVRHLVASLVTGIVSNDSWVNSGIDRSRLNCCVYTPDRTNVCTHRYGDN